MELHSFGNRRRRSKVVVQKGQAVQKGQLLIELDSGQAKAELAGAQARIAQAQAEREVLTGGGRLPSLRKLKVDSRPLAPACRMRGGNLKPPRG